MMNESNEKVIIGLLANISENLDKLVKIAEKNAEHSEDIGILTNIVRENHKVLKTMDWKLWEQMKISKSTAHANGIKILEPEDIDNNKNS